MPLCRNKWKGGEREDMALCSASLLLLLTLLYLSWKAETNKNLLLLFSSPFHIFLASYMMVAFDLWPRNGVSLFSFWINAIAIGALQLASRWGRVPVRLGHSLQMIFSDCHLMESCPRFKPFSGSASLLTWGPHFLPWH